MAKTYKNSTMHSVITASLIKGLLPADEKIGNYICFDEEFKMFGVRVTSTGFKSYVVKVPNAKGNYSTKSLGHVDNMKPSDARFEAQSLFNSEKAKLGYNTLSDKELTFKDLAQKYLNGYAKAKKKKSSYVEDERRLNESSMAIKTLGHKKLQSIKRGDIIAIHEAKSKTPYEANRTLSLLSKVFNYAIIDCQMVQMENPCVGIKKYKEHGKQNIPDKDTQKIILDILNSSSEMAAYVCKLRFFTGARVTEALQAQKSEFEIKSKIKLCLETGKEIIEKSGTWKIPHERMKSNKVEVKHLPNACIKMLEAYMPQIQGEYLFPGADGKPIQSTHTFFKILRKKTSLILAIKKEFIQFHGEDEGTNLFKTFYKERELWLKNCGKTKYSKGLQWIYEEFFKKPLPKESENLLQGLRQYDIRHMYATELAIQGTPIHVVKEMMGHSTVRVTEKYLHNMKGEKEKAAEIASKAFDNGNY